MMLSSLYSPEVVLLLVSILFIPPCIILPAGLGLCLSALYSIFLLSSMYSIFSSPMSSIKDPFLWLSLLSREVGLPSEKRLSSGKV